MTNRGGLMDVLSSPLLREVGIVVLLLYSWQRSSDQIKVLEHRFNVSACGCDRGKFGVGNIVNVTNENKASAGNIYELAYKLESDRYEHVLGVGGTSGEYQCGSRDEGCAAGCRCSCNQRCVADSQSGELRLSGGVHADVESQHAGDDAADASN